MGKSHQSLRSGGSLALYPRGAPGPLEHSTPQAGAQLTPERSGPSRPSPLTGCAGQRPPPAPSHPTSALPRCTDEHVDQSAPTFARVFGRVSTPAGADCPGSYHRPAVRPVLARQMVLTGREFPQLGDGQDAPGSSPQLGKHKMCPWVSLQLGARGSLQLGGRVFPKSFPQMGARSQHSGRACGRG